MNRVLLIAGMIVCVCSCSKKVGQYHVRLSYPERKTLHVAVGDSVKAAYFIDTLTKAHKGLVRTKTITRIDTFFAEPKEIKKEKEANQRYSKEEYERLEKEFKARVWTIMDSLKMNAGDRDVFAKTIARDAIPIMEKGKINTDTVRIDDEASHFRAYMHKGTLVGELKKDRSAIAVNSSVTQTTITPSVPCPPQKAWFDYWQTKVCLVVMGLLFLMNILLFIRR